MLRTSASSTTRATVGKVIVARAIVARAIAARAIAAGGSTSRSIAKAHSIATPRRSSAYTRPAPATCNRATHSADGPRRDGRRWLAAACSKARSVGTALPREQWAPGAGRPASSEAEASSAVDKRREAPAPSMVWGRGGLPAWTAPAARRVVRASSVVAVAEVSSVAAAEAEASSAAEAGAAVVVGAAAGAAVEAEAGGVVAAVVVGAAGGGGGRAPVGSGGGHGTAGS